MNKPNIYRKYHFPIGLSYFMQRYQCYISLKFTQHSLDMDLADLTPSGGIIHPPYMSLGRIFLVRAWKTHAEAQRRNVTDQFVMGWPSIKDTSPLGQCNVFLGTLIHAHRYTRSTRRDVYVHYTYANTRCGIRWRYMCMHAVRLCPCVLCARLFAGRTTI